METKLCPPAESNFMDEEEEFGTWATADGLPSSSRLRPRPAPKRRNASLEFLDSALAEDEADGHAAGLLDSDLQANHGRVRHLKQALSLFVLFRQH